jgi:hypothetical protein
MQYGIFQQRSLTFVIIKSEWVACQSSGKRIFPHDICASRSHVVVEIFDNSVPWHANNIHDSFTQIFEGVHIRHLVHHDAIYRADSMVTNFEVT